MRDPVNFDTARFGGRVYVRDGWRWVPASLADLEAIEMGRDENRERLGWALSVGLIILAFLAVLVKESLA